MDTVTHLPALFGLPGDGPENISGHPKMCERGIHKNMHEDMLLYISRHAKRALERMIYAKYVGHT